MEKNGLSLRLKNKESESNVDELIRTAKESMSEFTPPIDMGPVNRAKKVCEIMEELNKYYEPFFAPGLFSDWRYEHRKPKKDISDEVGMLLSTKYLKLILGKTFYTDEVLEQLKMVLRYKLEDLKLLPMLIENEDRFKKSRTWVQIFANEGVKDIKSFYIKLINGEIEEEDIGTALHDLFKSINEESYKVKLEEELEKTTDSLPLNLSLSEFTIKIESIFSEKSFRGSNLSFKVPTSPHQEVIYHTNMISKSFDVLVEKNLKDCKDNEVKKLYALVYYLLFVVVHPFHDGNGRVARRLLQYLQRKVGVSKDEMLSISIEKSKNWSDAQPSSKNFSPTAGSINFNIHLKLNKEVIPDCTQGILDSLKKSSIHDIRAILAIVEDLKRNPKVLEMFDLCEREAQVA